jgi:hypothetical protein
MQNEICEDCWDSETHKEDLKKLLYINFTSIFLLGHKEP